MNDIRIIFLVSVIFLALIMVASIWYFNFITRQLIGKRHRILEDILQTKKIPADWSRRFDGRIKKLEAEPDSRDKVLDIQKKANIYYLKKLDTLRKYLEKAILIEDDNIRMELLDIISSIRSRLLVAKNGTETIRRRE